MGPGLAPGPLSGFRSKRQAHALPLWLVGQNVASMSALPEYFGIVPPTPIVTRTQAPSEH